VYAPNIGKFTEGCRYIGAAPHAHVHRLVTRTKSDQPRTEAFDRLCLTSACSLPIFIRYLNTFHPIPNTRDMSQAPSRKRHSSSSQAPSLKRHSSSSLKPSSSEIEDTHVLGGLHTLHFRQDGSANVSYRSLRISLIPLFVKQNEFCEWLEKLDRPSDEQPNHQNIRAMSLVSDGETQVATVAFNQEPQSFSRCVPGQTVDVKFATGDMLTVDCDFLGMTALYSSGDAASVE
jgi:hypothetical protein